MQTRFVTEVQGNLEMAYCVERDPFLAACGYTCTV